MSLVEKQTQMPTKIRAVKFNSKIIS